ncbi:MAG TPA: hypothetical protein VLF90_00965 [Patescibacteria group bacterium]|nr:hypothetical protein [Patescibacteria group bacterium]
MIVVLVSALIVFAILVVSEWLWRSKRLRGEFGRKFVHISVGSFVAIWPFYMSFHYVELMALAFFVVVLASRYLNIFQAIHTINRRSWGDALFAAGVGITALITSSPWIFAAAILHLSLADGFAAILGTHYGKDNKYKVWGHEKSWVGTATFWIFSICILLFTVGLGTTSFSLSIWLLIWLPAATSFVENISPYGLDNVLVPLLIVAALSPLPFGR